uniref:DB domain-containing protein n=1 Tax=Steinernema glaseri TaxID=37863 RepID=A0A1I7YGS6_9BILA
MLVALLLLLCVPLGAPLPYDTIVQGAKKCCRQDPETQSCCVRKLLNDSARLGCPTPEWHFIGACLEKFFWNTTFIAQHAYQCCALLHSPQCRRECSYTFRAPGLSPEVRRRFSPETSCQDPASLADDCRKGSLLRRHECFRPCLQLRLSNPPIFFFDPLRHCPHMDPATMNGCVGPANLMDVY